MQVRHLGESVLRASLICCFLLYPFRLDLRLGLVVFALACWVLLERSWVDGACYEGERGVSRIRHLGELVFGGDFGLVLADHPVTNCPAAVGLCLLILIVVIRKWHPPFPWVPAPNIWASAAP